MKRKIKIWVEAQACVQSPLQKLAFDNIGQELRKSRYKQINFLVLFNFA